MTTIIAFAGRKQSGKTTCSEFVKTIFNNHLIGVTNIYNFADPLKQNICIDILGLTHNQCYGSDDNKNELVDCYWDNHQLSAREVMQIVGTDIFRTMKQNVWSDAIINKINKDKPDVAIIADCRFPNEVNTVKRSGGWVIKLTRNPHNSYHASEMALDPNQYDPTNFDLIIDNENMSILEQNNKIIEFLKNKGMILL
jgi:hypothetical protein